MPASNVKPIRAPLGLLWKNLAIVGLYALAGLIGTSLPLPPGYPSPLWPSAGLGIAALLLGGQGCWPGVWLGSLLTNLWLDLSPTGAGLSALLASAETALAWLGIRLARPYLPGAQPAPGKEDGGGTNPDGSALPSQRVPADCQQGGCTSLDEISAQLRIDEQRDRFFALALDLFCIAGKDGYLHRINPAFSRTLGWSEEELLSRPFMAFVHPDDLGATQAEFERVRSGEVATDFENRYICKDGSFRWLTWKTLPQPGETWFATARDTTEQHLAAQQLKELNAQLEQRIGEHSQALVELQEKKEELRAVLDHLLDCVITLDCHGNIQGVNAASEQLLGYRPEELIGRNVSCLIAAPLRERHGDHLSRELEACGRRVIGSRVEVIGQHKDGHSISLELSASEYHVNGERFLIASLRDIRERKALIAKLTQAREDAEQANRAKSVFLAAMSHEIRTPMNGIIGLIDVLAQDNLNAYQADLVQTIRESSSNLLAIINDILDFSKIEAGKLAIERAPLNLAGLVDSLCNSLLALARSQGVVLNYSIAEDVPRWVKSDATRLRQIFYNLIGNALKFSGGRSERPGLVEVRVRLASADPLRVAIAVEDNGIGIAPENLRHLFTPFNQGESATNRRFGGTGLGLAICKRLVQMLHGEIAVASTPGKGSEFTVTLPFEAASAPAPADAGSPPAHPARRRPAADVSSPRILVAEDDAVNRKVVQQQLSILGYAFDMADDGAEALELWRQGSYDLLLSDLQMPNMDGYQLTASIRREEAGQSRMPILALTANALRSEAERALGAGMDEYLTKPILLGNLGDALERWLGREGQPMRPRPPAAHGAVEQTMLVDPAALCAQMGEDAELIREILDLYLDSLRTQSSQIREAFQHQDTHTIGSLAHSLKAASRSVGAVQLGQLCAELEQAARNGDEVALKHGIAAFAPLEKATAARIEQWLEESASASAE